MLRSRPHSASLRERKSNDPPVSRAPPSARNRCRRSVARVTINDRGPTRAGRVIDLSSAAAAKIGLRKKAMVPVKSASGRRRWCRSSSNWSARQRRKSRNWRRRNRTRS
ncbi:MAG TPA: septal ring lytic transglycosylase RlpA family protein [Casimicrobiaceae bacterium]|nr:septal ring lytic transglycosylase RlpA family protein [Casimicrobiaceae bacterium]